MNLLVSVVGLFAGVVVLLEAAMVLLFRFNFRPLERNTSYEGVKVAILVAVRDEAVHLADCLEGLVAQEYPKDRLQIWIGNDASSDDTLGIARTYEDRYAFVKVLDIRSQLPRLRGKANVLAQLVRQAEADVYFITDADVRLPATWVSSMLAQLKPDVGIVTGATVVRGRMYQCLDWLTAMGMMKASTDVGGVTTGMGNNMLITRAAYEKVGGYENLPFSITEDLALSRAVQQEGYRLKQVLHASVLGISAPTEGLYNLLQQRKRWMKGAMKLPWFTVTLLFLQVFFLFFLLVLALASPYWALGLFLIRGAFQSLFLHLIQKKVPLPFPVPIKYVCSYSIYGMLFPALAGCFFFLPLKVRWKGRSYG